MKIKKIKNKHEEGFVLVVSLLILAVSIAIGGGTVYNATKQVIQSKNWERSQQALYAAEAGAEDAKKWLQDQYDDENFPKAGSLPTNITCYEGFSNKGSTLVEANKQPGQKVVNIKDFIPDDGTANNKDKRESLENYLYRYYISEATVVSGKKISSNKGSIEDKGKQNEVSNSAKLKKFITAICGEAPNNQRVFLEVIFRAEEI